MKPIIFLALLIILIAAGCSILPAEQQISTPEATHAYVLSGSGRPIVIFEAGLGDGKESWAPIYQKVGEFSQVFAYDRAGYGTSRSSNPKRDGATIVRELHASLQALNLNPPYLLVGHSIGGTYMELFARTYPNEIAGVVLVDSRHADFSRQCTLAGARSCKPPVALSLLLPRTPAAELKYGDSTMNQVLQGGPFPNVPLAVLTSVKKPLEGQKFLEVWLQTQASLASMSALSSHEICNDCGHYIHKDKPELVISAIRKIATGTPAAR